MRIDYVFGFRLLCCRWILIRVKFALIFVHLSFSNTFSSWHVCDDHVSVWRGAHCQRREHEMQRRPLHCVTMLYARHVQLCLSLFLRFSFCLLLSVCMPVLLSPGWLLPLLPYLATPRHAIPRQPYGETLRKCLNLRGSLSKTQQRPCRKYFYNFQAALQQVSSEALRLNCRDGSGE